MPRRFPAALVLVRAALLLGGAGVAASAAGGSSVAEGGVIVGLYHWGGSAATSMRQGVARIAGLGGHAARVTLSPRYYTDYNIGSGCYPDYSLTALAREPDVLEALGNKLINTVMLTAYDGSTFGDCATHHYVSPAFYTPEHRAAIVREFSDFTLHLHQAYRDSGKQFIISNWEADNAVYCGSAYYYETYPAFREECLAAYADAYDGNKGPAESLEGLKYWFQARELGIADGRNRAHALGLSGVEVFQAPEISVVRTLRQAGMGSVLYDVLPGLGIEHVSYSSYESINRPDPVLALRGDVEEIRAVTGARQVVLGEFGCARSAWGSDLTGRIETVLSAAASAGVHLMFYWQLFEQDVDKDYGLYDSEDRITALGLFFRHLLSPDSGSARHSQGPRTPGFR